MAIYSLDDGTVTGSSVVDLSGNGYDGTTLSGVATGQPGKFGQAFYFSGSNSEINAPAPYTFGDRFSISFWLNTGDLSQIGKYLLFHGTLGSNQNAIVYGYVPNTLQIYAPASTGPDAPTTMVAGANIPISQANAWTSVIYSYDGTRLRGYLNGSAVFDIAASFTLTATGPLYIGSSSQLFPVNNFVGLMDDVAIFDTPLTQAEVDYLQTHPAASLPTTTITGIVGYGTALNSDGWFLPPRSASSFPLNNAGAVVINTNYCFNQNNPEADRCHTGTTVYPTNGFLLTGDGTTYDFVGASGPGTFLQPDGFAIDDAGGLAYQRGPIFEGTPPEYQVFGLAYPYSNAFTVQSPADHRYASNLSRNSIGQGATIDRDTSSNAPRAIRLKGDGTIADLGVPGSNLVFDGFSRGSKILENGSIYVALATYDASPQQYEIWRFATPGDTAHTVVYALPITAGSLQAWDVNQAGSLVVAEADGLGQSVIKTMPAGGAATIVGATAITGATYAPGVFINNSGLVAAVRAFTAGPQSGAHQLLYARAGDAAIPILASGARFNDGLILDIQPTSDMNEAGQLTVFMQLDASPVSSPVRSVVARVNFAQVPRPGPTITAFSPTSGAAGISVAIAGTNFAGATTVQFNGTNAGYVVDSATQITATVPVGATSGTISVTTPDGIAVSGSAFTVTTGPAPVITSLSPASGGVGTPITVKGVNLGSTTSVRFNGVPAAFQMKGTQIVATVPGGATTGPIAVTTPGGTATSGTFTVIPSPSITAFTPTGGPGGTTVTITGTNFSGSGFATTAVKVGGSSVKFTVVSSTVLAATISNGTKSGPISVTTPGGTATTSPAIFTVTK
jgi:hypothetical protein